jgi:hypothetical protein
MSVKKEILSTTRRDVCLGTLDALVTPVYVYLDIAIVSTENNFRTFADVLYLPTFYITPLWLEEVTEFILWSSGSN